MDEGLPFVFGFAVYESFETEEVAKNGKMIMPTKDDKILGGHAVMAVGYNDKGGHVYIIVTSKCCVSGRSIYPEQNTYQRRDYNYVDMNKNYHGKL